MTPKNTGPQSDPDAKTQLLMIRHGPTEWSVEHRLQGRLDIPLSDRGRAMIAQWQLPDWARSCRCYTSPLARARETAQLLSRANAVTDDRLIEMDWASWEGLRLDDLRAELGDEMAANEARGLDFRPKNGESPREVIVRVEPWLAEIGALRSPVLAVTHKGLIRAVLAKACNWDMHGKPPVKMKWGTLHLFDVDVDGSLAVVDTVRQTAGEVL